MPLRSLASPALTFSIPSFHDGHLLECRMYFPADGHHGYEHAAIIAHPYAPLGGSFDDPVVSVVGARILEEGWTVMTFNFRGAGGSQGRTSWTGAGERLDYASAAGFLLHFLAGCQTDTTSRLDIVFAGYSYGSMIAATCPALPSILAMFSSRALSAPAAEIVHRADELARTTAQEHTAADISLLHADVPSPRQSYEHTVSLGSAASDMKRHHHDTHDQDQARLCDNNSHTLHLNRLIAAHHLLISPILPPVSTLTALPLAALTHRSTTTTTTAAATATAGSADKKLEHGRVLALSGAHDGFTSARKAHAWAQRLRERNAAFEHVLVAGAGHFWREAGVGELLAARVGAWVRGLGR